jgi:hypothetical protein
MGRGSMEAPVRSPGGASRLSRVTARGVSPLVRRGEQLALPLPHARDGTRRGGARRGAGRKRVGARGSTPHRTRPQHRAREPVLVTMRAGLGPLRSRFVFPTLKYAIGRANRREPEAFRIVHFSVQRDHLHFDCRGREPARVVRRDAEFEHSRGARGEPALAAPRKILGGSLARARSSFAA